MKKTKILLLTGILSIIIFILLLLSLNFNWPIIKLDSIINSNIEKAENPLIVALSESISNIFSTTMIIIAILLLAIYHWIKKERKDSIFSFITIMLSAGLIYLLKGIVQRTRPENILITETDFSFPSGHATLSLILFGIITYFVLKKSQSKKLKITTLIISIIAIITISSSRLFLNAHWLTDILAGFSLGAFVLSFCILFRKFLEKI